MKRGAEKIGQRLGRRTAARLAVRVAAVALGGVVALSATPVFAQKVIQEPDRIVTKKKTVIDFEGVNVEGDLTKPEGSYVLNRPKAGFPSRIKLRGNFQPELQKSVDAL